MLKLPLSWYPLFGRQRGHRVLSEADLGFKLLALGLGLPGLVLGAVVRVAPPLLPERLNRAPEFLVPETDEPVVREGVGDGVGEVWEKAHEHEVGCHRRSTPHGQSLPPAARGVEAVDG